MVCWTNERDSQGTVIANGFEAEFLIDESTRAAGELECDFRVYTSLLIQKHGAFNQRFGGA
jgi:hypothetical protein